MRLFKRKVDPIDERSRSLQGEIAALEAEIRVLNSRIGQRPSQPRLRSTALPGSGDVPTEHRNEPDLEMISGRPVVPGEENAAPPVDDLEVRRFDLSDSWRRFRKHVHGPPAHNPKLINYLAAGSIKGLRPLRYEKRVARNRFLALFLFFLLLLLGLSASFF